MALPTRAYPGLILGPASKYAAGPGTHQHGTNIVASLVGSPSTTPAPAGTQPALPSISVTHASTGPSASKKPGSSGSGSGSSSGTGTGARLPTVGSVVLGTVTRVAKDRVTVAIAAVDGAVVGGPHDNSSSSGGGGGGSVGFMSADTQPMVGQLRREDVRGWEVDRVVTGELFRVGDVVRAAVVSVGDSAGYYLSTARNELGVLMARASPDVSAVAGGGGGGGGYGGGSDGFGAPGAWMVPLSWKEFRDPDTGRNESRKVAKPV